MTYIFPDIGAPTLSSGTNAGSSYSVQIQDSTISTTSDANYKHTRPRTTRMIATYTYVWNALTKEQKDALVAFFRQVGTFQQFEFTDYDTGEKKTVRFAEALKYQFIYPRYVAALKFEEV